MLSLISLALAYFILGAVIGSFLSVCSYRIPMGKYEPTREGIRVLDRPISIIHPKRSFCPHCDHQLSWWHTIPLFSWPLLGGRCFFCKERIPFRYLFIELLTGALCTICFFCYGPTLTGCVVFLFVCLFVVISFIDIDYMIIPDAITYPATAFGILVALINKFAATPYDLILKAPFVSGPLDSVFGLLIGPGTLLFVYWVYLKARKKEGIGLGDIKLLAVVGATFGAECAWFTIFIGSVIGAILGIVMLVKSRSSLSTYLPLRPLPRICGSSVSP